VVSVTDPYGRILGFLDRCRSTIVFLIPVFFSGRFNYAYLLILCSSVAKINCIGKSAVGNNGRN
jgi:hypothetical protein